MAKICDMGSVVANEVGEDNIVQNCDSFAHDWIKSQHLQTSCNIRVRIWACLDSSLMGFEVSWWCAKSNASCTASSRVRTLSSR